MAVSQSLAFVVSLGIWALSCAAVAVAVGVPAEAPSRCAGRRLTLSQPTDCGEPGAPVTFDYSVRRANRSHFAMSGAMHLRADVSAPVQLALRGALCRDGAGAADVACRPLMDVDLGDMCERMQTEGAPWTHFFDEVQQRREGSEPQPMPKTCPVAKAVYTIENYLLEESDFCATFTINGLWKVTFSMSYEGKKIACLKMNVDVSDSF